VVVGAASRTVRDMTQLRPRPTSPVRPSLADQVGRSDNDIVRALRTAIQENREITPRGHRRDRRRRWRRWIPVKAVWGALGGAVVIVVGVILLSLPLGGMFAERGVSAPHTSPSLAAAIAAHPAPDQWRVILEELDARRGSAFAQSDPSLLAHVYLPGSEPLRSDSAVVRGLAARQGMALGVRHRFSRVTEIARGATSVTLRVVERMESYTVIAGGREQETVPSRGDEVLTVTLGRADGEWRISTVSADPTPPPG
jgi:hypothetical protein